MAKEISIAFVIATKDRPEDIRALLRSLLEQNEKPDEIIIVDSGSVVVDFAMAEFPELEIKYIRHERQSASAQRNVGVRAVDRGVGFIGFLDDDVVLEKGAFDAMVKFLSNADEDIGGFAFNIRNGGSIGFESLKRSSLSRYLGLYSDRMGVVTPSGWATIISETKENIFTQWLPSTAVIWRRNVLNDYSFEEFFEGYSYLEDLDFSYRVGMRYRLIVVAEAGYHHNHSVFGRINSYQFGKIEVVNRIFLVRKNKLSLKRCLLAIIIRMLITIYSALDKRDKKLVLRFLGNCSGLLKSVGLFKNSH